MLEDVDRRRHKFKGCLVLSVSFQFKEDGSGGGGENGEGRLELIETLDEGLIHPQAVVKLNKTMYSYIS